MGIYLIKPRFQKTLTPVKNWFVRNHVHPTVINVLGLLCSIATGLILLVFPTSIFLLLIPVLVFVRTAFNALDGLVSRELGVASAFGEVLNECIDRISDAFIFLSLAFGPSGHPLLGAITTVAVLLNSYVGIVSKAAGGTRQYGGLMGKADRMIYLGIASIVAYFTQSSQAWYILLIFVLAGTIASFIQRINSIYKELHGKP